MFRFSDFFKKKEPTPSVFDLQAGDLSLRVMEFKKDCGHPAFLVEVCHRPDEGEEFPTALFQGEDLQRVVILLQETLAFVNDNAAMPRQLQTTRLRNDVYYVDERLRELRRKDDPSDRIPLDI